MAEAERIRRSHRPPHHRLHRRDPPLQQGAAGRVPAARRGRRHRADRRDHREPVVRGERGAAVALEGLRAARPDRPRRSRRSCGARSTDPERGLGSEPVSIDDDALTAIALYANGDARSALNLLELSLAAAPSIDLPAARRRRPRRADDPEARAALRQERRGALQPHLGAAQVDAQQRSRTPSVYWLARMVEAGEDPLYIARRLVRFASEDIGNADPQALTVAVAAKDAVHFIGMPEGNTALAQAAIYLATAPKSNAVYEAYNRAAEDAHRDVAAAGAAAPAQRADQADEGARLRQGLPVRARRGRTRSPTCRACPARSKDGNTTSRRSAASRRRSSGASTAGKRSKGSDALLENSRGDNGDTECSNHRVTKSPRSKHTHPVDASHVGRPRRPILASRRTSKRASQTPGACVSPVLRDAWPPKSACDALRSVSL